MPQKLNLSNFINKAKEIHGDKYDYSLVDYVNVKTKVKIICPIHGEFEKAPSNHLHKTQQQGCILCSKTNLNSFIEKANKIHNNKYDYSLVDYKNTTKKIKIICPEHGVFAQIPSNHIQGRGCFTCGKTKKRSLNQKECLTILNNYNFKIIKKPSTIKSNSLIVCECTLHGIFNIKFHHLKENRICPKCNKDKIKNPFKKETFINFCNKNNIGIFYILECFNEEEKFYKIGITSRTIQERYKSKKEMPYSYNIILELKLNPEVCWNLEKYILKNYKDYKYTPNIVFAGIKECFKF